MKKLVISIVAVVVVIGVVAAVMLLGKSDISFHSMAMQGEDYYIEAISVAGGEQSEKTAEKRKQFETENEKIVNELFGKFKDGTYQKPIDIRAVVSVKNGQTLTTYSGYATTADGKRVTVQKQFTVDAVLTREIPEEFQEAQQ